jgi:hypothetical protein
MKIIILSLVSLLCLASIASAVPDNVNTGAYKISFDIGLTRNDYRVTVSAPLNTESLGGNKSTEYDIKIINNTGATRLAIISLYYYEDQQTVLTPSELVESFRNALDNTNSAKNIDSATREIDGVSGAAASYDYYISYLVGYVKIYLAEYYPTFDKQHVKCVITSTYPWDEGALQLLKTIHVEKARS